MSLTPTLQTAINDFMFVCTVLGRARGENKPHGVLLAHEQSRERAHEALVTAIRLDANRNGAIEALAALDPMARRAVIEQVCSREELEDLAESWFNIDREP